MGLTLGPLEGPRVDLLRHFPAHCLLALGGAAAGLWLLGRPRLAAGAALCCLLPAAALRPLWTTPSARASRPHAAAQSAPPLRVAACNLLLTNRDLGRLSRWIEEAQPDLLALSECTPAHAPFLAQWQGRFPHQIARPDPGHFGIALLSRFPLQDGEILPLGVAWAPTIRVTVQTPQGPIGVVCLHPPQPASAAGARARDAALAELPTLLAPLPAGRVVLGDCNATRWSAPFARALAASGLRDSCEGHGYQGSWPAALPAWLRIPIDHVLVSDHFEVVARGLGPDFGSDHLPVWADLTR